MSEAQITVLDSSVKPAPLWSEQNQRLLTLLFVNLGLAVLWQIFLPAWGATDYLIGFVIGALALIVYERSYGWRIWWLLSFVGVVLWDLVRSNLKMMWQSVQPHPYFDPGIVAIPLTIDSNLEVIILATVITLGPGSLSMDLRWNERGQRILYVHFLVVEDPEQVRQSIKSNFERRLLLVTRGEAP
jgi:multicomponent Na+:H+ antiporter subunit E